MSYGSYRRLARRAARPAHFCAFVPCSKAGEINQPGSLQTIRESQPRIEDVNPSLRPEVTIECPILNRLADMLGLDTRLLFQVRQRAAYLQNPVVGAS